MLVQMSPLRTLALRPRGIWTLFLSILLLTAATLTYFGITATRTAVQSSSAPDLGKLPLSFELNVGQTSGEVRYMSRASGGNFFFTPSEVVLSLAGADDATGVLRTSFVDANPQVRLSTDAPGEGKANYLLGNDPANWHANVPTFAGVNYAQIYSGIDLAYSGTEGHLKSTYTVAPGADPTSIKWRYTGASSINVDQAGNLQLSLLTNGGTTLTATEAVPVAWQTVNGQNVAVSAQFKVFAEGTIGFVLGSYNTALPLVIDPTLLYSTYLGGSGFEYGAGVRTDADGYMYIGGQTASANFPVTNSLQPTYGGGTLDAFVAKLNPEGTELIYSTFLGGSNLDGATDIQLNDAGEVYLVGFTASTSFPISNAIQSELGGNHDAFVSKLNAEGSGLLFSTYLGGGGLDEATRSGVDSDGNIYLGGFTQSSDFPLHNAYQQSLLGIQDAFFVKIPADGAELTYATYFGGTSADAGYGATVDDQGNAYLSGYTLSANLPVLNAYQAIYGGEGDAFVAKFSTNGASLLYSTYIGGSGNDVGEGMYVDALGNAHLTGSTASSNFPTANAFQSTKSGGDDAFVTKLSASGSSLIYSTFIGGNQNDIGSDLKVDAFDNAYVTGGTYSANFPTLHPVQATFAGTQDAFVARFGITGTLGYSTFLGGTQNDYGNMISVDDAGNAYVTGFTESTNFPTIVPFQASNGGTRDAIVVKLYDSIASPTPIPTPTSCVVMFEDVAANSPFYTYIRCLACQGIINGYPCGDPNEPCVPPANNPYFRAGSNVTRGQLAKIVSEAAGFDDAVTGQTFQDVEEGSTFWLWVERLVVHEVMSGYACGGNGEPCVPPLNLPYFRPNGAATRGQVTKIVANSAGFDNDPTGQTFEDVPPASTYYTYTQRLATRLIMGGYTCGSPEPCVPPVNRAYFRPYANVTRGQTSKIMTNTFFPDCNIPR